MSRIRRLLIVSGVLAVAVGAGAAVSAAQLRSASALTPAQLAAECSRPLPSKTRKVNDYFMRFDVEAESTDSAHKGEIDVLWLGIDGAPMRGRAPRLRPLVILKYQDKASPNFYNAVLKGSHFPKVVLKQSESAVKYFHMTMENVLVTNRVVSGDRTTGDRLCLSFTKAKVEYRPRNADGSFGPLVRASL